MRSKRVVSAILLAFIMMMPVFLLVSTGIQSISLGVSPSSTHVISQLTDTPISITSNTDFVTLGATGVGTRADPYILSNYAILASSGPCISVTNTTAFFVIINCILESGPDDPVILFDNVENGQVLFCEITGGSGGIEFYESRECSASNNTIYGCWIGIHMTMTTNSTISFSNISSNNRGLLFEGSNYSEVENNSIYSNLVNGLEFAWFSHNNTVIGNSFGWNGVDDDLEGHAVDHGDNNYFDDGVSRGNAWSDFNGTIPYRIRGTTGTNDSFPELLEDNENPVIQDLPDTAIDVETSGNLLTWTASDEFPEHYTVEVDDFELEAVVWAGGDIVVDLDDLPIGSYRFVITIFDGAGNSASDSVQVTVVSFVLGGIGTELVMIASGITVVVFLVIILIIKKLP